MGIFPGLNQVGLSDQQREQVRGIMEQERQSGEPGGRLRDAEEGLHTALLADTPDPQAIQTAKAALIAAQGAELDHRVELMQKIAAILTPAQRQQLAQMQPPAGGRRGGH
jgi:Spy/CpxP family protein refolding chaperone